MKYDINIVGIVFSLILGGLGIILGKTNEYGYALLFAAVIIIFIILIIYLYQRLPSIYIFPEKAKQKAKEIYELAAKVGGSLYATHIFPKDQELLNDIALAELKNLNNNSNLSFDRILILENQDIEEDWIERIFTDLDKNIKVTVHVLDRYPLYVHRLVKAIIPRINLLLYQTRFRHFSLIGLDKLYLLKSKKNITFSLLFRSKRVYEILLNYFTEITSYADIVAIRNKEEFKGQRELTRLPSEFHRTINHILQIAENTKEICFVGIFGSLAKILEGHNKALLTESDFDFDILVIYNQSENDQQIKTKIKNLISDELSSAKYNIVWGDDEDYFYEWRDISKINMDFEIHPYQSDYYTNYRLLGLSIFRYLMPLYSLDGRPHSQYIQTPIGPLNIKKRIKLLLNDRKGIIDFKKHLLLESTKTSPKRVLSLILRNLCWAESGHFPISTIKALEYLEDKWDTFFKQVNYNEISSIFEMSKEEILKNYKDINKNLLLLLEDIISYSKTI